MRTPLFICHLNEIFFLKASNEFCVLREIKIFGMSKDFRLREASKNWTMQTKKKLSLLLRHFFPSGKTTVFKEKLHSCRRWISWNYAKISGMTRNKSNNCACVKSLRGNYGHIHTYIHTYIHIYIHPYIIYFVMQVSSDNLHSLCRPA